VQALGSFGKASGFNDLREHLHCCEPVHRAFRFSTIIPKKGIFYYANATLSLNQRFS
jgi:hypothetical protein